MASDIENRLSKLKEEISFIKKKLYPELLILAHHYQREEIVEISDFVGDSYYLAKTSSEHNAARYIVFCGVRFMAEAAAILCNNNQKVLHPDKDAGCPLADMADLDLVMNAWNKIGNTCDISKVMPIAYINSSAELKAFCGRNNGLICTSSNAKRALEWGFSKGDKVFFFPDQHLGRNTAALMGIKDDEIMIWDPDKEFGKDVKKALSEVKLILWNGFCHVHTFFTVEDILSIRKRFPETKIIVHPECAREVVEASDEAGSTSYIVEYVKKAPSGSTIAIGTEINLISRLAKTYPDKRVIELKRSFCPNMFKITLEKLFYTLKNLDSFEAVKVSDEIKKDAKIALQRMLEV